MLHSFENTGFIKKKRKKQLGYSWQKNPVEDIMQVSIISKLQSP